MWESGRSERSAGRRRPFQRVKVKLLRRKAVAGLRSWGRGGKGSLCWRRRDGRGAEVVELIRADQSSVVNKRQTEAEEVISDVEKSS